jgi:hypothetical protein
VRHQQITSCINVSESSLGEPVLYDELGELFPVNEFDSNPFIREILCGCLNRLV